MLVYININASAHVHRAMPLGLQMVSAAAKQVGWQVQGRIWSSDLTLKAFAGDLEQCRPGILGFYTDLFNIYTIARLLKKLPQSLLPVTILGGPEATLNYRRVLVACPADILVRGDGEPIVKELLSGNMKDPEFLSTVEGISYRADGRIMHNPDRRFGNQADYPFPDRELLQDAEEKNIYYLMTARGCPNRCAFCSEALSSYRPRPVPQVLDELRNQFSRQKPDWIVITDDTFTAHSGRVRRIADFLQKEYGGPWSCEVTARDICRQPEMARTMVRAGLTRAQIGIESGNDETLKLYGKRTTREKVEQALSLLFAAGVKTVFGNYIVGAPQEDAVMVRRNMEFAADLIRKYPGRIELAVSVLSYNPGAPFFERPEQFGLSCSEESIASSLDLRSPVCATESLSKTEILQLHEEFWLSISQAVVEQLPNIPPDLIRDHLRFRDLGIITLWGEKLLAHAYLAKYHQMVDIDGSHVDLAAIDPAETADAVPQRTRTDVQLNMDGQVILSGLSSEFRLLNATASLLDEMACGYLSIREIAQRLHQRLPPYKRPSIDVIISDAVDFYSQLAREMHIVFVAP